MSICPCGSTLPFSNCCEPALSGERPAATAEALMRSRYCAYATENWRYLYKTWHPQLRPTRNELSKSPSTNWQRLEIVKTKAGNISDNKGSVEFIAHFEHEGQPHTLHEVSQFEKLSGGWVYVEGEILEE